MISSLLISAFYLGITNASSKPPASYPTATIDTGILSGIPTSLPSSNTTVNKFLGIPFGELPVRFAPPVPTRPWESIYDASEYRPSCVQTFFGVGGESRNRSIERFNTPPPPAGESEDCLNLNVYVPDTSGSKAVMFWIFGGSFKFGSGSLPLYDGSSLAAHEDVVVVTMNYRTNVFGFPGSPDLPEGKRNLGFLDQRLALDWVHRNIAAFGGDPERVTLFGESAGAFSVDALTTSPPYPLQFRAAILQSSQATIVTENTNTTETWAKLVKEIGCVGDNTLECMRIVPSSVLRKVVEEEKLSFGAEQDGGITWSDSPRRDRLESKNDPTLVARVPMLVGSNADEGRLEQLKNFDLDAALAELGGGGGGGSISEKDIEKILGLYPVGQGGIKDQFDQLAQLLTEYVVQCKFKVLAEENVQVGIPTWRYLYNASFPNSEIFEGSGAYHTAEIEMVFGTYDRKGATEFQRELSRAMQKAWAAFAKDPMRGPGWGEYPELGVFGDGVGAGGDEDAKKTLRVVDSEVIDQRCKYFEPIYDSMNPVPWE
ncbi:hypothetical protein ACJ41O_011511 [Fusarium nematophilum]